MKPRNVARGAWACLLCLAALPSAAWGQPPKEAPPPKEMKTPAKPGVSINEPKAYKGYTLIAPMNSRKAQLIDLDGRIVHTWDCDDTPALSTYLLDNGNLLRPLAMGKSGPGAGGRVQEIAWDGSKVWDYSFVRKDFHPHHDITRMPNGNILMVVGHRKTKDEAIAAGRRPESANQGVESDCIIEIKPTGPTIGEIVWEWHAWDHLVQEFDKTKNNFDKISAHPELIDINYGQSLFAKGPQKIDGKKDGKDKKDPKDAKDKKDGKDKDDTIAKLQALGYLGAPNAKGGPINLSADWTHVNSVAYNAELDQIMISVHSFSEFWIIDHSTTTKEAAGHTGGKYGKGGDLIYRWGNPQAYRNGSNADQRLFKQHNAHWIPKGLPGEGHILVFNNGQGRPDGQYSSVDELVLPMNKDGSYERKAGLAYGPSKAEWSYTAPNKSDFNANFISGAHRLANGNTLICSGPDGTVFEVTKEKEVVWKFVNPGGKGGPGGKGKDGKGPGGKGGPDGGPGGFAFGPPPQLGQILPTFLQDSLKLNDEQKKKVAELQKEVDAKLESIMNDDQRAEFKKMREGFGGAVFAGGFPGGKDGKGGPGGAKVVFPPGGKGGGPGPGGMFRSYRYGVDHPAFQGKTLTPGKRIEEL
jgi:hypothetical protein